MVNKNILRQGHRAILGYCRNRELDDYINIFKIPNFSPFYDGDEQ